MQTRATEHGLQINRDGFKSLSIVVHWYLEAAVNAGVGHLFRQQAQPWMAM